MSLLSNKDRKLAIEALEHYNGHLATLSYDYPFVKEKIGQVTTLINWIKLEEFKNKSEDED
jgi:hypothetical protein